MTVQSNNLKTQFKKYLKKLNSMRKIILALLFFVLVDNLLSQDFILNFTNIYNFFVQEYTLEQITDGLKPTYEIVSKWEKEWKFRDDSKSWEAILYVQFNPKTLILKEIQFLAPNSRALELMDELEKKLDFKYIKAVGNMDIYENTQNNLGVKLFPYDFIKGLTFFRMYRL